MVQASIFFFGCLSQSGILSDTHTHTHNRQAREDVEPKVYSIGTPLSDEPGEVVAGSTVPLVTKPTDMTRSKLEEVRSMAYLINP